MHETTSIYKKKNWKTTPSQILLLDPRLEANWQQSCVNMKDLRPLKGRLPEERLIIYP